MTQGRAITSEQTERLLDGLRHGMTRRAAAAYAGFSKSAFYRMLDEDDGTFGTEVENAEGEAEAAMTKLVANAAVDPKNWTAAAWWLERRHPDDYGKRERVEVTFNLRKFAEERGLDPDEVMAEADAILSARNARG